MKILVVTGASGGHIFPALGFLETLKDRDRGADIFLILPAKQKTPFSAESSIIKEIEELGFRLGYVSILPLKLNISFRNIFVILGLLRGILESISIVLSFRPDIVIGFGTLASVPFVILARVLRIKTLIHEQNVIAGRANKFLARFADRVAISFPEGRDSFRHYQNKVVFTGNPLRKELVRIEKNKALDFFGFKNQGLTLLVMGGSIGSHNINIGFLNAISKLIEKSSFQIIHLAGNKDYGLLREKYKDLNIRVKLFSFLKEMEYAYSASDLAICRAGATTITELIAVGLPAIIIPYSFAYGHQLRNAEILEKKAGAIIIRDSELRHDVLGQTIENLFRNPDKLKKMRLSYDNLPRPQANDLLVKEAVVLRNEKKSFLVSNNLLIF